MHPHAHKFVCNAGKETRAFWLFLERKVKHFENLLGEINVLKEKY